LHFNRDLRRGGNEAAENKSWERPGGATSAGQKKKVVAEGGGVSERNARTECSRDLLRPRHKGEAVWSRS